MGPPTSCALVAALLLLATNAKDIGGLVGNNRGPNLVRIPLLHRDELDVFARVRIGALSLDVVVDTGSSETWVATGSTASDSLELAPCLSDEQRRKFTVEYGGGHVTGRLMWCPVDLVAADAQAEKLLSLSPLWMGEIARVAAVLDDIRADGVLGLGMEALQHHWAASKTVGGGNSTSEGGESSVGASHKPLLLELLAQSGRSLVFSIFISPAPHLDDLPTSQLVLGGVDPGLVAPNATWTSFPVVPHTANGVNGFGFWALRLCGVTLGDDLLLFGCQQGDEQTDPVAVLDSGSTLLLLPPLAFRLAMDALSRQLGPRFSCSQREHSAFQSVECDCRRCTAQQFPDLAISLGSSNGEPHALVLTGADYVWCGRRRPGDCSILLDVDATAADDRVVLGAVFLRAFYSAFDYRNKLVSLIRPVRYGGDSLEPVTRGGWRSVAVALAVLGASAATLALLSTLDDAHWTQ